MLFKLKVKPSVDGDALSSNLFLLCRSKKLIDVAPNDRIFPKRCFDEKKLLIKIVKGISSINVHLSRSKTLLKKISLLFRHRAMLVFVEQSLHLKLFDIKQMQTCF